MNPTLLHELAKVVRTDAFAIADRYDFAYPPKPFVGEDRVEYDRLRVLASRIEYRAMSKGQVP